MLLFKFSCWFSFSVAALNLSPRDVTPQQNCLNTINSDLIDCRSKCNAYTGGTAGAIPLQQCGSKLSNDIKSCTSTINSSPTLTSADAGAIINYLDKTILPSLQGYYQCLTDKKAQFTAAGLYNTVKNQREDICNQFYNLIDTVIARSPSDKKSAAQATKNKYQQVCSPQNNPYPKRDGTTPFLHPRRDISKVLSCLQVIDQHSKGCTSATPVPPTASRISQCMSTLTDDVKKCTNTINDNPKATLAESKQIISYLNGTIVPDYAAVVDVFISKKQEYQRAGLYNTAKQSAATLGNAFLNLGDAVIAKTSADQTSAGQSVKSRLNAEYQRSASAYP